MVPAKELNKLIIKSTSSGDILIPKEIGEGLFGVSFKMKGIPGDIKTSVNPIRTLTPRFIQKALEKKLINFIIKCFFFAQMKFSLNFFLHNL